MTAVHSISYDRLDALFYIFGIFDTKSKLWLSWEETTVISHETFLIFNFSQQLSLSLGLRTVLYLPRKIKTLVLGSAAF